MWIFQKNGFAEQIKRIISTNIYSTNRVYMDFPVNNCDEMDGRGSNVDY